MPAARLSWMLRLGWRVHRWLYRVSGGLIGDAMNDPAYAEYQQRTSRRIPVVLLEPVA